MTTGRLTRCALAEFLAAFVLVLIGTGAIMTDSVTGGHLGPIGVALAFGLVVSGMV